MKILSLLITLIISSTLFGAESCNDLKGAYQKALAKRDVQSHLIEGYKHHMGYQKLNEKKEHFALVFADQALEMADELLQIKKNALEDCLVKNDEFISTQQNPLESMFYQMKVNEFTDGAYDKIFDYFGEGN